LCLRVPALLSWICGQSKRTSLLVTIAGSDVTNWPRNGRLLSGIAPGSDSANTSNSRSAQGRKLYGSRFSQHLTGWTNHCVHSLALAQSSAGGCGDLFCTPAKWTEYAKGESIRAVSISFDGSKLAFIGNGDRGSPIQLHLVDVKTGAARAIPVDDSAWDLSWAPDSEHVVYEQTEQPAVYVLELRTGKASKIADGRQPSWSPSGDWIAYFNPSGNQCWVIRPDGKDRRSLLNLDGGRFFFDLCGRPTLRSSW
jgi:hypothetical protein